MIGIVGLAPSAARECRERFRSAAAQLGLRIPGLRITVNLSPADVRKDGAAFDLPVAAAVLAGSGHIPAERTSSWALVGELGLDGRIRPVRGVLPIALRLSELGALAGLIVPIDNLAETRPVRDLSVLGARTLEDVLAFFRRERRLPAPGSAPEPPRLRVRAPDYGEVSGHEVPKRALEVAAAGGHNVLLRGPAGAGKTMLARAFPTILPPLSAEEAIEATAIHSITGHLPGGTGLLDLRPFRAPHHTVSTVGLVGGGVPVRPGEVSLAHRGVLFLDELPEFRARALDALRQPLEERAVHITRAHRTDTFPASFVLIAAMNPCRCGKLTDSERTCRCDPSEVRRYLARISGPLLDRIDIHVDVPALGWSTLREAARRRQSPAARDRVRVAREIARSRTSDSVRFNGDLTPRELRRHCRLDPASDAMLHAASLRYGLSARACHRLLRVARTVADLASEASIRPDHLAEALQYRVPSLADGP